MSELKNADHIVIGSPVYNFSIPAALKARVDLIARAGLTFRYSDNGPIDLLENKKATIVMASGGVPIGSEMDMTSNYLKFALRKMSQKGSGIILTLYWFRLALKFIPKLIRIEY